MLLIFFARVIYDNQFLPINIPINQQIHNALLISFME